jgi:hypothetical protein
VANPNPPLENLRPKPWKPGQSGNPAGYSRGRRLADTLVALIDETGADKALMRVMLRKALEGDPRFMQMVLDRVDGKVAQKLELSGDLDALKSYDVTNTPETL